MIKGAAKETQRARENVPELGALCVPQWRMTTDREDNYGNNHTHRGRGSFLSAAKAQAISTGITRQHLDWCRDQ